MDLTPLSSTLGARIDGITLADGWSAADLDTIKCALLRHHVVVLPQQSLTDDQHRAFADAWDVAHPHPVARSLGSEEVLAWVENDAERPPQPGADSGWHTDYTFHTAIADAAMLYAEVVPPIGGDTLWASTHAAYDALSPAFAARLEGMYARHDLGPKFAFEMRRTHGDEITAQIVEGFPGTDHPVVVRHPCTGRKLLFVNPGYTTHIVGMAADESRALLDVLFEVQNRSAFAVRHRWTPGDLVVWDEWATVHQGPSDFFPHHRRLRRCTVGERVPS